MNTKTRLKLTVIAALFLGGITIMATIMKIMTILSAYIWAQTKRPSGYELPDSNTQEQNIEDDSALRIRNSVFPAGYQADKPSEKSEQGK
jgi:hypothetical protein